MKLNISCFECHRQDLNSLFDHVEVVLRDDGLYETICPNGHTELTVLSNVKFEVLFEIGAHAILDGYYREAISSFSSSLERFYEFFLKVLMTEKGLEWESILNSWKSVSNQSERQLGAYIIMYTSELGEHPPLLKGKLVNLRNKVIHQGKIPTKDEVMEYGQAVLDVIRPVLKMINERYSKGAETFMEKHQSDSYSHVPCRRVASSLFVTTILNITKSSVDEESKFVDALRKLEDKRIRYSS
ncbi:hypothetical protein HYO49_13480 [Vibrio parahaemolyticus]|nr:hypothetical protein [Vibrio parahaemolyticus]